PFASSGTYAPERRSVLAAPHRDRREAVAAMHQSACRGRLREITRVCDARTCHGTCHRSAPTVPGAEGRLPLRRDPESGGVSRNCHKKARVEGGPLNSKALFL